MIVEQRTYSLRIGLCPSILRFTRHGSWSGGKQFFNW